MPKFAPRPAGADRTGHVVRSGGGLADRRAAAVFLLRFVAGLVVFYAVTMLPWFQQRLFPVNLRANASVAAGVLRLFGEQARSDGAAVVSPRFAIEVRRGCEAIEPAALFVAAVLAFPASWRRRLGAVMIGVPVIAALNIVRIVTLYYAGVFSPEYFETIHLEVWQTLFVISTLSLWLAWAWRVSHAADSSASVDAAS